MGFGREATLAATFGVSQTADIAVFLIGLPDFLVNVLGSGGFTALLVVAFRQSRDQAVRLLAQASLLILASVGALALLLILFADALVSLLAPGFSDAAREIAVVTLPLVLLSAPVAAATGATIGYLQANDRFFIAAMGTAVINAVLILALLTAPSESPLTWLAAAVFAGAMARWLVQLVAIGRPVIRGFALRPWLVEGKLMAGFARAAVTEAVVFFYPFALRALATLYGVGTLASVSYATKLVQLPLGVVVMTLTIILLPRLAASAASHKAGDSTEFLGIARPGQYWILALSTISAALLIVHGAWLVEIAYGWGAIEESELAVIALYNAVFSLSLLPTGLNVFIRRVLNALGETRAPLRAEAAGFGAFLLLSGLVLFGGGGMEWVLAAAAAGNLFSTAVLLRASHRREVPLARALLKPAVWLLIPLAGLAAAVPGLALAAIAPENAYLPLAAIAVGGLAALGLLIGANREARDTVKSLVRRAPAQ